jgi:hypothetical protein
MVMKDFTRERKKIEFKIDNDLFEAKSPIPAQVLMDFASKFSNMSQDSTVEEQLVAFRGVLELVLMPTSLKRFVDRMSDVNYPIAVDQVEEIVSWLFEEYGLRPTEVPSSSSSGQGNQDAGTKSTVITPAGELIS